MPFMQIARFDSGFTLPFVNVEHAVGRGAPNRRDDVKLVQYLLNAIGYRLVPDGFCGPKTQRAIQEFQEKMRASGTRTVPDGRVDRARGEQAFGAISNTVYAIVELNRQCFYSHPSAWYAIPMFVHMKDPASVEAAGNDYSAPPQMTSVGGPARGISSYA